MRSWLLRGLVFAFLMTVLRIIQGPLVNSMTTQYILINVVLVLIYAALPLIWGYIDGRSDANAQPDPDRRSDLAMTWLIAGIVAGVLSGAVCSVIKLFYENIYVENFMNELTVFAAFTALLTFLMAMIGVAVGRRLVDRRYAKEEAQGERRRGDEDGPDTDVFAAVSSGRTQREATEGQATQEAPPREARTQEARTEEVRTQEARTEEARTEEVRGQEARTEEVRTQEIRGEGEPTQEAPTRPHRKEEG
jgi:hypothetical protein